MMMTMMSLFGQLIDKSASLHVPHDHMIAAVNFTPPHEVKVWTWRLPLDVCGEEEHPNGPWDLTRELGWVDCGGERVSTSQRLARTRQQGRIF